MTSLSTTVNIAFELGNDFLFKKKITFYVEIVLELQENFEKGTEELSYTLGCFSDD